MMCAVGQISCSVDSMHPDVIKILERVKQTADFGYVDFSDINATNALGNNALHCVIVWGDYEAAKILVANGINVNQKGEEGVYSASRSLLVWPQGDCAAFA
jgi:ankyrin repeat protein